MGCRERRRLLCLLAVNAALGIAGVGSVEGQEVRVLLIRPVDALSVPPDAARVFEEAIRGAAPDLDFVTQLASATDLIEFTSYEDDRLEEGRKGVTCTWRFSYRPLDNPDEPPAARARPGNYVVSIQGDTRADSLSKSREKLRGMMRSLLERFRPFVPR